MAWYLTGVQGHTPPTVNETNKEDQQEESSAQHTQNTDYSLVSTTRDVRELEAVVDSQPNLRLPTEQTEKSPNKFVQLLFAKSYISLEVTKKIPVPMMVLNMWPNVNGSQFCVLSWAVGALSRTEHVCSDTGARCIKFQHATRHQGLTRVRS
ncbi:hypothetical protein ACJ72_02622 [Emergomyces africanus]|uniref:Uncharacterized protein n=1 Tax=Emergomyces africanus TaxID=1955775 RepID=A0A1B7P1W3_9EURO|nr:hypothetical protein ACJ72_02622 [Emergomyces africanus]